MRVDGDTIIDMFDVLHDKIVEGGAPKILRCMDSGSNILCNISFDDVIVDPNVPSDYYFKDPVGSTVIRGAVLQDGVANNFEIRDGSSNQIITGSIGLLNSNSDIELNAIEWQANQVVVLSSLKIVFPTES